MPFVKDLPLVVRKEILEHDVERAEPCAGVGLILQGRP
jgi:hypothetical protein